MQNYILRLEGVNFDATVTDTQDLSCIRGSSLAILWAPERVRTILKAEAGSVEELYTGASQAAFRFSGDDGTVEKLKARIIRAFRTEGYHWRDLKQAIKAGGNGADAAGFEGASPLAHLRFVVDIVRADDDGDNATAAALAEAEARNRARQFRTLTVNLPEFSDAVASLPDPVSRILPGETTIDMPPGSITPLPGDDDEPGEGRKSDKAVVSKSVAARRFFGRELRQAFYRRELEEDLRHLFFTDSLGDIPDKGPDELPEQVRNKTAVFYADGNKFGAIRERLAGADRPIPWPPALAEFSVQLNNLRKNKLLRPLVSRLRRMAEHPTESIRRRAAFPAAVRGQSREALRFETLLWGGDEVIFVAPAWLGFWLVEGFFTLTKAWDVSFEGRKEALTHAVGLVICDRKTPIRQSTAVAKELAEKAKGLRDAAGNPVNAVQIEIFESADLPEDQLGAHRRRLYPGLNACDDEALDTLFTLPGELFLSGETSLIHRFGAWQDTGSKRGLPRSQLYRLLQMATRTSAFALGDEERAVREALTAYTTNAGRERDIGPEDTNLWAGAPHQTPERPLALSLALMAQYWDFAAPFAQEKVPLPSWTDALPEAVP